MSQTPLSKLRTSERGMVAIMTTMILIVVISLIVLGFAQIARRNQREALDRQLSTQAFYAAETGVNDARKIITDAINANSVVQAKDTCTGTGPGNFYAGLTTLKDLDTNTGVSYSCVLVDPAPKTIRYSDIGTNSVVVPLITSGANINTIELRWQSKLTGNPLTSCPTTTANVFARAANWTCGYGVLRFDLVPTAGTFNSTSLQNNTMTVFAVPYQTGGTNTMAYRAVASNGEVLKGVSCSSTECRLSINSGLGGNNYHMRVSSLYRNVALQIRALDSSSNPLSLQGVQALIDVTGRAKDVLRRVQVNVPLRPTSQNQLPDYALQSTESICKRFSVMNNYYRSDVTGVTSTNRLCQP